MRSQRQIEKSNFNIAVQETPLCGVGILGWTGSFFICWVIDNIVHTVHNIKRCS